MSVETAGSNQRPGRQPHPEPGLAPAHMVDEPLGHRRVHGHAQGETEGGESEGESPFAAEPLGHQAVAVEHQRALSEKSQGGKAAGQEDQVGDVAESYERSAVK